MLNYDWEKQIGSVEPGKLADVIAVAGDPLRGRRRNAARAVRDERRPRRSRRDQQALGALLRPPPRSARVPTLTSAPVKTFQHMVGGVPE